MCHETHVVDTSKVTFWQSFNAREKRFKASNYGQHACKHLDLRIRTEYVQSRTSTSVTFGPMPIQ